MKKLFIIYVIATSIGFSSCTGLFGEGQLDMAPIEDINEIRYSRTMLCSVNMLIRLTHICPVIWDACGTHWFPLWVTNHAIKEGVQQSLTTEHGTVLKWKQATKCMTPTMKFHICLWEYVYWYPQSQ